MRPPTWREMLRYLTYAVQFGFVFSVTAQLTFNALQPAPVPQVMAAAPAPSVELASADHCGDFGTLTPERSIELARDHPTSDGDGDGWGCDDQIPGGPPTATAAEWTNDEPKEDATEVPTPTRIEAGGGWCAEHDCTTHDN